MSEQTRHLVDVLRQRLQATIRRITLADLLYGLILTLGIGSALLLLSVAVEAGFWLETTPRAVLFWVLLLSTLGLVGYFLLLPLLRLLGLLTPPSEEMVARSIGKRYPEVSDRLLNLLQLVDGRGSEAPTPLLDGAVRMLSEPLAQVPFEQVEDFGRARRATRLASLPLVGVLVFVLAAPGTFFDAAHRLFSPSTHFQRPAPFSLSVEPGDTELVKGAALDIVVRANGASLPRTLTLSLNNKDEEHIETLELTADSSGVFRHTVVNVRQSMRYQAQADVVKTAWHEATVTERPLVRTLQVSLDFPSYTRIPAQRLTPNVGDVTALPGTRVSVDVGVGGHNMSAAVLQFDDGHEVPLELDGETATGTFTLNRQGTYRVILRNAGGLENSNPITYSLQLLSDAFPAVMLLEPSTDAELDEALRTRLRYRINDDFGFSQLRLYYRLAESRFGEAMPTFEAIDLPLEDPRQLDQELLHQWLIGQSTDLDPVPGDVIEYYVQVWDNDAVAGYKSARTETYQLRFPSLTEQFDALDEAQDASEAQMQEMLDEADAIREEFRQLRDELRQKQEGDWEDQRQLERIQERQQQLEQRVNDLTQQMENTTRQMEENSLVEPETLQMYEELQRVAEEINSPELQEALKQLQEAMQELNMQQMQEAIQNFEFNEEQYRQRLERTLDLFKRLRVQQKLDEAARRAEELARRQEQLAEKLNEQNSENSEGEENNPEEEGENQEGEPGENENQEGEQGEDPEGEQNDSEQQGENGEQNEGEQNEGEPNESQQNDAQNQSGESPEQERSESQQNSESPTSNEQLAQEQERSAEEMQQLEEQMRQLMEMMKELRNAPSQEMQELNQQTQQQQLPQQMQDNAQQMRQGENQKAQQQQQQMQQQLQQLQQQLQQMMQGMQGQQQQVNVAGLRRALSDVLTLSEQQEAMRQDLALAPPDTPRLREFAQKQVELSEGLATVSDTLQHLARAIPQMTRAVQKEAGDALRAMSNSTEALAERSSRIATGEQKTSMMHLNELALLLSDLMNQMQNQQSGGSGMSMQQMLQQLQQMSQQQQQLNEQIQQMLNDMQGNRLTNDMQERLRQMAGQQDMLRRQLKEMSRNRELSGKALGDLEKIAEEMEETIEEMQRGEVNRPMIQRQQRILTRLLDASKSMQQRGKENRREGRSADDLSRESPGDLPAHEEAEQLRKALLKALESGYAPDYEELIKRYFELLQQQQQQIEEPGS